MNENVNKASKFMGCSESNAQKDFIALNTYIEKKTSNQCKLPPLKMKSQKNEELHQKKVRK